MQIKYCQFPERCYTGEAPSLARLRATFGDAAAEIWLEIQINDLSEFAGCKDKLSHDQIQQTAVAIITAAPYLKVTEIMLFFTRFKQGIYGRFYGGVDGLIITTSLQTFLSERKKALIDIEQKQRAQQLNEDRERWRKEAISREEYEEVRWLYNMGYERDLLTGKIR